MILKRIDTLSRETNLSKLFLLPSEKGVYSKSKELVPKGEQILSF